MCTQQTEKSTTVDPITTELMDPNILYDAPLREKIYAMIDTYRETGVIPGTDENQDSNGGISNPALSGPGNAVSGNN